MKTILRVAIVVVFALILVSAAYIAVNPRQSENTTKVPVEIYAFIVRDGYIDPTHYTVEYTGGMISFGKPKYGSPLEPVTVSCENGSSKEDIELCMSMYWVHIHDPESDDKGTHTGRVINDNGVFKSIHYLYKIPHTMRFTIEEFPGLTDQ